MNCGLILFKIKHSAMKNSNNNNNRNSNNKIPFLSALRPVEMIGIGLLILAALMYGLSKCSGDRKSDKKNSAEITNTGETTTVDPKSDALRRSLYVCMDSLRMRRAPHKDSATVKLLGYGEEITDMGEYQNEQTIKITPEYSATEPWIKVKTKDGRSGWVFGAGVRPYPKKRPLPELKEKTDDKDSADNKDKTNSTTKNQSKKTETKEKTNSR